MSNYKKAQIAQNYFAYERFKISTAYGFILRRAKAACTLIKQMESENRKNRRVKYQRNIYAGCAAFAIAYAAAK